MADEFILRPAIPADFDRVRDLHARAFAQLARSHHDEAQIAGHIALIRSAAYAEELQRANLAAAINGTGLIVATAGWQAMPERPGTARIRKVFVEPAVARRGLGRRMVVDAERRARKAGLADLYVRANINAVPLYLALGYRAIGKGTMPVGAGIALPVVFMEKTGRTALP